MVDPCQSCYNIVGYEEKAGLLLATTFLARGDKAGALEVVSENQCVC